MAVGIPHVMESMEGREEIARAGMARDIRVNRALGIVAVVLAVIAIILALMFRGPGPAGAPGTACWDVNQNGRPDIPLEDRNGDGTADVGDCAGRPGEQGLVAYVEQEGGWTINATCTHYANANVSITVPGPGTIIASATIQVTLTHSAGTEDLVWTFIDTMPTACTLGSRLLIANVEEAEGAGNYIETIPGIRPLDVTSAGTYSFYIDGFMVNGQSFGDEFTRAELVAVFYPL
ncbi:MAG TPA: hypothetical protein VK723_07060 [Thermoplasmata archaeon]|nr:hypothetical protein [Thermoplasmata archaeon]